METAQIIHEEVIHMDGIQGGVAVSALDPDAVRILTIEGQMKVTLLAGTREIGRILSLKKESLPHGEWGDWLKKNLNYSQRKATDMIRIYRCYGDANWQTSANFTVSKALALLALPESEREEFVESSHQVNGQEKTVADMSTRELEQAIRERDEARKELEQARAEISVQLNEQQTVYDVDMANAKGELDQVTRERDEARRRLDEAHKEIAEAHIELQNAARLEERLKVAQEKSFKSGKHVLALQKELEELKARPVEVAVEKDEEALQELEEERDKALEEIDALRRSLAEADANHMEADAAREVLSQQMKIANARIRELESGGPEGVDTNPMQFRLFVDEARDCVNRALGVLFHLCDKEDQTEAQKAQAALMELAEYIREAAA